MLPLSRYELVHFGARFSANAIGPSFASLELKTLSITQDPNRYESSIFAIRHAWIIALVPSMESGAFWTMISAI